MSDAPPSSRRSARSDLPLPGGPMSSTPASPIATAVAWTSSVSPGGDGLIGDRALLADRHSGEGTYEGIAHPPPGSIALLPFVLRQAQHEDGFFMASSNK